MSQSEKGRVLSNWCKMLKCENCTQYCASAKEIERNLLMTLTANGLSTAGSPNGLSSKFDIVSNADFH